MKISRTKIVFSGDPVVLTMVRKNGFGKPPHVMPAIYRHIQETMRFLPLARVKGHSTRPPDWLPISSYLVAQNTKLAYPSHRRLNSAVARPQCRMLRPQPYRGTLQFVSRRHPRLHHRTSRSGGSYIMITPSSPALLLFPHFKHPIIKHQVSKKTPPRRSTS